MPEFIIIENPTLKALEGSDRKIFHNLRSAFQAITGSNAESVLLIQQGFWGNNIPPLPVDWDEYDLIHSGLCLGGADAFHSLWYISPNWLFLNPRSDRVATSWKTTPHWCMIRPDQVRTLDGFEMMYSTPEASLMDFAYRLMLAGGRVNHVPLDSSKSDICRIPFLDEMIFLNVRINSKAAAYAAFWTGPKSIKDYFKARKISRQSTIATFDPNRSVKTRLVGDKKCQQVKTISAIIPTIGRYGYVQKSIDSLLRQSPAPDEIIVVDQTPFTERQPEVYAHYDPEKVRVFYLEEAGQSIARNVGLENAKYDWILLFEDDAAAWNDMMENHIVVIEHSGAIASTGVSLAPWKDISYIPEGRRHLQISSVFSTGICLIKKKALKAINNLDRAYDKGSGADHDLGLRLYLEGNEIIFNPGAIHTHYKAAKGGLRTFKVVWRHTINWWGKFPQPTLIYTTQRFYPKKYWLAQYLLYYVSAKRNKKPLTFTWLWISMPWRLFQAVREARHLHSLRSV